MNSPAAPVPPPEMSVYRRHTVTLLRRYFNMSVELGRLPNILGREFFRANVHGHVAWFEDSVLFVHDVERCLQSLHPVDQLLIARCIFQEYTHEEAARLLRCNEKTVRRRLPDALDQLTVLFLERKVLRLEPPRRKVRVEGATCEEQLANPPADAPAAAPPESAPVGRERNDVTLSSRSREEDQNPPEPGIIPDLQACGNLFVKPPLEAFCP